MFILLTTGPSRGGGAESSKNYSVSLSKSQIPRFIASRVMCSSVPYTYMSAVGTWSPFTSTLIPQTFSLRHVPFFCLSFFLLFSFLYRNKDGSDEGDNVPDCCCCSGMPSAPAVLILISGDEGISAGNDHGDVDIDDPNPWIFLDSGKGPSPAPLDLILFYQATKSNVSTQEPSLFPYLCLKILSAPFHSAVQQVSNIMPILL